MNSIYPSEVVYDDQQLDGISSEVDVLCLALTSLKFSLIKRK